MGYTKEYIRGFCEFLFGLFGVFIIIGWLNSNCKGSCRHIRGLGDNVG